MCVSRPLSTRLGLRFVRDRIGRGHGRSICIVLVAFGLAFPAAAQGPGDWNRLAHPEVAERLGLDDAQRAAVQRLLQQRTEARLAEDKVAGEAQVKELEAKLRQTLTEPQWQAWETTPPSDSLEFRFREQPWADVLQWFAAQEGLTLVMDRSPPGTFTYHDNRQYTPSEAIDLLNSVLLTRGFTLIRREKLLTLMQISDSIPIELIPETTLEALPSRGRFELVRVKFPLGTRPVEAVMKEVSGYLGPLGRAIPLPQSKQLLVVETAGKMEMINVLVNSVPEPAKPPQPPAPPKPPEPVFAAYPLGDLDPTATLAAIKALIGSERILVDGQTRVLHAYVTPEQQLAIQAAIEKMSGSLATRTPDRSVAYDIGDITPEVITTQLQSIAPQAVVSVDEINKKALVTATAADQERISAALESLGGTVASDQLAVETFPVEPGQAVALATALKAMLPRVDLVGNDTLGSVVARGSAADLKLVGEIVRRYRGEDSLGGKSLHTFALIKAADAPWLRLVERVLPTAELWLDDDGKRLVMIGSDQERQRLEANLTGLMTAIVAPADRQLEVYELNPAQLALWTQLQTAVVANLPDVQVIVKPGEAGGLAQVMVWASQPQHAKISQWVEQIRQSTPEPQAVLPRLHELGDRDPKLFGELLADRYPGLRWTADERGLMVWADRLTQEAIATWIQEVQAGLPAEPTRELKTYRVTGMLPTELQTLVTPLLGDSAAGAVTVDSQGGRLVVMATEAAHQRIESLVSQLSAPPPTDQQRVLVAYSLEHADADELKAVITAAVTGATVLADASRRQLIATATLGDHGKIKTILAEVDRPATAAGVKELRTYRTEKVQAATLLPTLQKLMPRMELTVDATNNQLLASGIAADQRTLQATLERLRSEDPERPRAVKTFTVPAGDLQTLPTILLQLAPEAVISTDVVNRAVIVWGTDEHHQRIGEAITQLSQSAQDRDEVLLFEVPVAQTVAIQTALSTLFTGVRVSADPATGQLTLLVPKALRDQVEAYMRQRLEKVEDPEPRTYRVRNSIRTAFATLLPTAVPRATMPVAGFSRRDGRWRISSAALPEPSVALAQGETVVVVATPTEHLQVAELLKTLDTELGPDQATVARVYTLGEIEPTAFATLLAERRPSARLLSSTDPKRPVVADLEAGHAVIAELVIELETAFGTRVKKELRVHPVRDDLLAQATSGVATVIPEATLLPSAGGGRLSLLATPEDHQKWNAWLEQLQTSIPPPQGKSSRVYQLKDGDPTTAVRLLQSLLPAVVMAADVTARTVAATASDAEHARIQEVITQVDQPASEAKETRVFTLGSGNARELVVAVTQMLPRAGVTAETASNSLIVTATAPELQRITEMIQGLEQAGSGDEVSRTYTLKTASPVYFQIALRELFPRATVAADPVSGSLLIAATEEQHVQIAKMIQDLNDAAKPADGLQVFKLQHSEANQLAVLLQQSFGRRTTAGISADAAANAVLIVGTPEQHELAKKLIEQLDQPSAQQRETRVFPLAAGTARELALAVGQMLPAAKVTPETSSNSLIVSATSADLLKVTEMIEGVAQAGGGEGEVSRTYTLKTGSPVYFQIALRELFPRATVAADPISGSLLIAATEPQHVQIAQMIQDLNESARTAEGLKVFKVQHANPTNIAMALQQSFGRRSTAGVTADEAAGAVFVVGSADQHEIAGELIQQLDQASDGTNPRTLRAFSMAGLSGREVSVSVEQLFTDSRPKVDVQYDLFNEQLIVIGNEAQLTQVEKIVEQFKPPQRSLEVFALRRNEPRAVDDAITTMFSDLPFSLTPSVTVDQDRQQLIIRASAEQLVEIRALLQRLGETTESAPVGPASLRSERLRTIPVGRDAEAILKRLREVWPTVSNNPLQVIGLEPEGEATEIKGVAPRESQPRQAAPPAAGDQGQDGATLGAAAEDGVVLRSASGRKSFATPVALVAAQVGPEAESKPTLAESREAAESGVAPVAEPAAATPAASPIVLIPGAENWTIASEDPQALELLSRWIETAGREVGVDAIEVGRNSSIFVLKHANAAELENVLTNLFRRSERNRTSTTENETRIVADPRINALVVRGSQTDRTAIRELLAVLDSPQFIGLFASPPPVYVPVMNTDASRIEQILRSVYAAQLSRGGGRPPITIPSGVSTEIATMLEQINASVSGPLLQLSVDEVSNAIVMRAPPELSKEVRGFIEQVDTQATTSRSRGVRVVPLSQTNAEQIRQLLESVQSDRRGRNRR